MKEKGRFLQKSKMHKSFARVIACTMVAILLLSNANLTAFAAEVDPYGVQTLAVTGGYETLTIDPATLNGSTIYGLGDTAFSLDQDGGFFSSAHNNGVGSLPDSGYITVGNVPYQFTWEGSAPYAGKDSIRLSAAIGTTYKTMELKQYGVYDKIYVLGTAAGFSNENKTLEFSVDLYYTDGTSTNTKYKLGDWYRDDAVSKDITLYTGLYRKDVKSGNGANGYMKNGHGPRLQSMAIECDPTRLLSSIKFTMLTTQETVGSTTYKPYAGIYAVTGKVSDSAPATPNLHENTDAYKTSTSFTAKWDVASNNPTKYYIDVATDAAFSDMVSGYNNKEVGNVTEYKVEGLTQGTTYYYRVRSANNAGQSLSSDVRTAVPDFKKLPSPELTYENTAVVGESTLFQSVSWLKGENVANYRWFVDVTNENGVVSTYTGDLSNTTSEDSAYVVTNEDATQYWLDITNLVDGVGTYTVSVVADPVANSDEYLSSDAAIKNINIVYPDVTVDVTDELKASGIVSGIGGDCEKSVTNGVLTLTAKNANAYSELGTWYKSGAVFDTGVSTSLTADTQYVDSYELIFDINRTKLDLVADENGNYTLKLKENIILEEDLVFAEDITLDLNGKNIIADTNAGFEVDDAILNIKNGKVVDATVGTDTIISTIDNGAVIIESNVALTGVVGGDAEVKWTESDGSTHYTTMKDAVTEDGTKEAADNSVLTLLKDKTLSESTTVPESITVYVPDGVSLSVPEGVVLSNNGSLITDGTISNAGTIENSATANWQNEGFVANTATGKINNAGSMDNSTGQIDNAGEIKGSGAITNENGVIITTEGRLQNNVNNGLNGQILSEVSWNDENGKWFGPIEDAVEYAAGATEDVTIDVQGSVVLDSNLTIPENATLNIPENKVVTVPQGVVLDNNGEIVESGTLQVNGTLASESKWTDGANNHYGTLNDALDKVKDGESITLLEDKQWTEEENLVIPEDTTLIIPNDVVLEVEEDKVENPENIKSESSWKKDDSSGAINYGSLKDAVNEAVNSDNDVDITLRDDVVVEENLEIPSNARVEVPEDTSLTIPEDIVVDNNGSMEIADGGELNIEGALKSEAAWKEEAADGTKKECYGSFDEAMDAVESEDSDVTDITIMDDVVLGEDVTIPEDTNLTIDEGASLTVPSGKELENNGNITNNGTLNNNGTVSNNKDIVNNGLVDGSGSIANSDESSIDTSDGMLKNTITDENGTPDTSKVESEATLVDPVTGDTYYGGLASLLKNADAGDEIVLNKNQIVLDEDVEIPNGVTLNIPDNGTVGVPEGKTLVNNGVIKNNGENGIVVTNGTAVNNGTIDGSGKIVNNGGLVDLTEGVTTNTVESTPDGTVVSEATWTIDNKTYRGSIEEALQAVENAGGGTVTIDAPELDLEESIIIPEGVTLVVPEDTKLNIPEGVTVENNGRIISNGEVEVNGTLNSDASWKDKTGKVNYGNISEALEAMQTDENEECDVTEVTILDENVSLPEGCDEIIIPDGVDFEIADGADLVIPEGTKLVNKGEMHVNGNIGGAGTIDNAEGTIEMGNGAIKSDIEAGKEGSLKDVVRVETEDGNSYYTSIEEALGDEDAKKVTALGDVNLKDDITIPEGVTLEIPEGATLTVPDGKTMINNGVIENDSNLGIIVNKGSAVNNGTIAGDGSIVNKEGFVDLTDGITTNEVESMQGGTVKSEASWEKDGKTYHGSLEKVLEEAANNGGGTITIEAPKLDIEESITIPEDVELVIPEGTEVTIEAGVTLDNNGNIVSNGTIKTEGTGKLKTDASWTDENGEVTYGSIEDALEAMQPDENGASDVKDVTILGDDVRLPEGIKEVEIPEGVKLEVADGANLVIPEGTELVNKGDLVVNGDVSGDGAIDNSAGSIEMGNGTIKTEFDDEAGTLKDLVLVETEDGDSYYTSIEEALRDPEAEKITVVSDTELKEDVVIPEDVTLVIPEDVKLIVPEGTTLENNGAIENNSEYGIYVKEGTAINNGTIDGNGSIVNNGGFVDLTEGVTTNTVENLPNSTLKSEATWTIDDKTYRGSLEEALEAVTNNGGGTITIDTPELNIEESFNIPEDVVLVVPEDTVLNIKDGVTIENNGNIISNGEIKTEGTGKLEADVSWKDKDGKVTYGSLEEALEAMQPDENGACNVTDVIILGEDVTLPEEMEEVVIPEGVKFEVADGADLVIPEDTKLVNKGEMLVNGELSGPGTIDNAAGSIEMGNGAIKSEFEEGKEGSLKDVVRVETEDGNSYYTSIEEALRDPDAENVTVISDTKLKEDIIIPEDVTLTVPEDVTLTVPEGTSLVNNGEIVNDKEILVQGGTLTNKGEITGEGAIINKADGTLDFTEGSTSNTVIVNPSEAQLEATWTIDGVEYKGSLENAFAAVENAGGGDVTVNVEELVIDRDLTIPEGVTLVIPEDTTVTIGQDVVLENNGAVENNGHVDISEGYISGNLVENSETGTQSPLVMVKTEDHETYYTTLENALDKAEDGDVIVLVEDTVLTDDIVIPENVKLKVAEDVTLTVPQDVVLKNNGTIENAGAIENAGVIDNTTGTPVCGEIAGEGQMLSDAVWTQDGNTYYGSIEDGIESVKLTGGTVTLNDENMVIDRDLTIPANVTLEVPEGTEVIIAEGNSLVNNGTIKNEGAISNNGNIVGSGTLNNENGVVDSTNGVVSNAIENGTNGEVKVEATWIVNGKEYYGSLDAALEAATTQTGVAIEISGNLTISESIVIPEGATLTIKKGVTVTIEEGVSLTNKGTIVNNGTISADANFVNQGSVAGGGKVVDASKKDTGYGAIIDSIISALKPEQPENEADVDTDAEEVIEEEPVIEDVEGILPGIEEQEQKEAIIAERNKEKEEAQIVAKDVVYEDVKSDRVKEDINVGYGEGEISIVIDTLDEVGKLDTQMYNSVILSELSTVVDACLTPEEKMAVETGSSVEIRLTIQMIPAEVDKEDIVIVEETVSKLKEEMPGIEIAGHLDICIEKNLDGTNWNRVPNLNEEIDIQFEIPENMRVEGVKYSVLRVHDGETTLLEDLDDDANTITIRTKLFSVYSILYENEEVESFNLWWLIVLVLLIITVVTWIQRKRNQKRIEMKRMSALK